MREGQLENNIILPVPNSTSNNTTTTTNTNSHNTTSTTINGSNNKILNDNSAHMNINIMPYNKPNTSMLTLENLKETLGKGFKSPLSLIELMHFNKAYPQNHNMYISNARSGHIHLYDGEEWIIADYSTSADDIISDKIDTLNTAFEEHKHELEPGIITKFTRFINEQDDPVLLKKMKKDMSFYFYNNRQIIKNSIKQLTSSSNNKD